MNIFQRILLRLRCCSGVQPNGHVYRFLIRIAVFLIVYFFVINPFLFSYFDNIVMKNSLIRRAHRQFDNLDSLNVLILGDSHSQAAVNPDFIPDAFNFSADGESYIQTLYKSVSILEPNELGVDVVIVPLDLHSFSSFRTERVNDPLYWRIYMDFGDLAGRVGFLTTFSIFVDSWIIPYVGNLQLAGLDLDKLTGNQSMQKLFLGFQPMNYSFGAISHTEREAYAQRIVAHHFEGSQALDERLLFSLLDIVDFCLSNDIEVVLISYPVSDEYLKQAECIISREEMVYSINNRLNENDVHYLDYSRLFSGSSKFFADSDHLNTMGARVLTCRLADDLERLNLTAISGDM